jgi:hypothetical protein
MTSKFRVPIFKMKSGVRNSVWRVHQVRSCSKLVGGNTQQGRSGRTPTEEEDYQNDWSERDNSTGVYFYYFRSKDVPETKGTIF